MLCRIKRLGLQDLSTLLWSLAQLQLQPPEDVLQELCEASTPLVPACDATHLTNIVWALGRLQARPCWELVEAVEAASLQVRGDTVLHSRLVVQQQVTCTRGR